MPITNRIITRGMGVSRGQTGLAGLVTQGYGGTPQFIIQTLENRPRVVHGRSSRRYQDELQLITVWAKMIEYNDKAPEKSIQGSVKVAVNKSRIAVLAERVTHGVNRVLDVLRVTAKRIK